MRDKAMPLGRKFKVRLTITPEETGTPVDMLGFTFTSGRNGHTTLNAQYSNIPKLVDDGLDSLSILVILKTLEMWAQKGYELYQPIVQRFLRRQTMSYKAKIFTREEFREVVAAAIYDYEQAPAKCLYTTKDAADQLYGHYGEETEVEE